MSSRKQVELRDLAAEPFVHFPRDVAPNLYDRILKLCQEAGFKPRVVQRATEWLTIISPVGTGAGVSLVPESFQKLDLGGANYKPLSGASVETTVAACWRDQLSPAGHSFIEVARECLGNSEGT